MCTPSEIVKSLEEAGFEILEHRDVALDEDVALSGGSYWYEYLLPSWNIFSQRFQVLLLLFDSVLPNSTNDYFAYYLSCKSVHTCLSPPLII